MPIPARRLLSIAAVLLALGARPAAAQCTANELAKPVALDPAAGDQLGISVSVDGDTAAAGAWLADATGATAAGAVYVFERNQGGAGNWGQVAKLSASDGGPSDAFGWSVALAGDLLLVGAYRHDTPGNNAGRVYVFERDLGGLQNWGEAKAWSDASTVAGDQFGYSVALSGSVAVVGAWRAGGLGTDAGTAYVYARNVGGTGNWGLLKQLTPDDGAAGHLFGKAVAVDGPTILVGAPAADGAATASGAAYVFDRFQGGANNYGQVTKLAADDGATGEEFGWSVSVAGPIALVGAYAHAELGAVTGGAYVYDRFASGVNTWDQVAELRPSNPEDGAAFGYAVALEAGSAVVGAYFEDGGGNARGAVYGFGGAYGGPGAWGQSHRLTASDTENGDRYGLAVAISDGTVLAGAPNEDAGGSNAGASYATALVGSPVNYCTPGTSASGCQARLSANGLPSASANFGFTLSATGVEGGKQGLFFFGSSGRQAAPWGNTTSFQCVVPPLVRGTALNGGGTNGSCNGAAQQDLNALWCSSCPSPAKNPGAGTVVQAQYWFRDPGNPGNQTTSLSDAIEFSVCP